MKKSIKLSFMVVLSCIAISFIIYACKKIGNETESEIVSTETISLEQNDGFDSIDWNEPEWMKDVPKCCYVQCSRSSCYATSSPCSCTCSLAGYAICNNSGGSGGGPVSKSETQSLPIIFVDENKLNSQNDLYHFLQEQLHQPEAAALVLKIYELFVENNMVLRTEKPIKDYYEYVQAFDNYFVNFSAEEQYTILMIGVER